MKKIITICLAAVLFILNSSACIATNDKILNIKAQPDLSINIDGKTVNLVAYNINDNNYFKLRDIANVLKGTSAQFDVVWNQAAGAVEIITDAPYSTDEEVTKEVFEKPEAVLSSSPVYKNDVQTIMTAYNIGGNNFFKLRDVAQTIDFGLVWSEENGICINTEQSYEFEGDTIRPVTNIVNNGNFGETPVARAWAAIGSKISADNYTATITGSGAVKSFGVHSNTRINFDKGQRFVYHMRVCVTDERCEKIVATFLGGYGSLTITKPQKDRWYDLTIETTPSQGANTQSPITIYAHYPDSETAANKEMKMQDIMCIDTSVDFGLGINAPVYLIEKMIENNGYWEDCKNVVVKSEKDDVVLNDADNDYKLSETEPIEVKATKPVVTFVLDDGTVADFNVIRPVSEKYNVPFTSAVFAGCGMNQGQMLYLQNDLGWEMASHTYKHTPLAKFSEEESIESALKDSREYMASIGLNCDTLIYPEGNYDERVVQIVPKYFKIAGTTSAGTTGINTGILNKFKLNRVALGAWGGIHTIDTETARIQQAIANNGWIIYMLHPGNSAHTAEHTQLLCDIIEYCQKNGVEIKNLTEAYDEFYQEARK